MSKKTIEIQGLSIRLEPINESDYVSLTDIALNFCYWISPPFQVWFIKEFQRLQKVEAETLNLEWHISKITNNIDEVRNLLDTIPHQKPSLNRLNKEKK